LPAANRPQPSAISERLADTAPELRRRLAVWSAEMSQQVERSRLLVESLLAGRETESVRSTTGAVTLDGLRTTGALVRTVYDRIASHRYVQQPQATIAEWNGLIETRLAGTRALETWRSMGKPFQGPKQVTYRSQASFPASFPASFRRSSLFWLADTLDRTADRMKQAAVTLEALACETPELQQHCEAEERELETESLGSP